MPIIFVSLSDIFVNKIKEHGYDSKLIKIEDYVPEPNKKIYYVSPANSLGFMDGGIDFALSRKIFPNIENKVKNNIRTIGIKNLLGRYYLPIGSSMILECDDFRSLIVAPTMLLPQDISKTHNVYYATMAILYNIIINKKEKLDNVNIIFTSFGCGYGKMNEDESIRQIIDGINDYKNYKPNVLNNSIIINEPNLFEQPKYYQNSEWIEINLSELIRV